ncbi:hypothetical protein [Enterobacter sp. R4-368]|uniref:hypothetical protein n=1 Tax=Enterobacter sp. R4-368 TaxID=1166130 RepID=UPI00167BF65B|nr:hypothetical protein [Enterobacter sp. R4-368]
MGFYTVSVGQVCYGAIAKSPRFGVSLYCGFRCLLLVVLSHLQENEIEMPSMLVVEMTFALKEQYPNSGHLQPYQETPGGVVEHVLAEGAATGDSLSPYSGGTVGGILRGSYDNEE